MNTTIIRLLWISCLICIPVAVPVNGGEAPWFDTYYQYRVPVELQVDQSGWQWIPIDGEQITAAVNGVEQLKFDPTFFAYNHLQVVDAGGKAISSAGFYMIPLSDDLVTEPLTGEVQTLEIPTAAGAYYLVTFVAEGPDEASQHNGPLVHYDQIFPVGSKERNHAYMSSYTPRPLPRKRMTHETLLRSDGQPMKLVARDRFTAGIKEISVKHVEFVLLAELQDTGPQTVTIYYQPLTGHHLSIPRRRREVMPHQLAGVSQLGAAERHNGLTRYALPGNEDCDVWFAETTVKLTPQTPVPESKERAGIEISCAKNESQSFQLVIRPHRPLKLTDVVISDLRRETEVISSKAATVRSVAFVPIRKHSYITATQYLGPIGDPLVAVEPTDVQPDSGNHVYWITVAVPPGVAAGPYKGSITVQAEGRAPMKLPLGLTVYDFELPEFSGLQASLGADFFQRRYEDHDKIILDYHGLSTQTQLEYLASKYYEVMAANKFYPRSVAAYGGDIDLKWSPPPQGYNVDAPENQFRLYDWDFTKFDRRLKHFIDELKVNSLCLAHTNPQVCNVFRKLADIKVAWGPREGDYLYGEAVEITRDQFDHLVLDYYRTVAEHLQRNGWLDFAYIIVDETMDVERIFHFCKLMKSDALTARIKLVACMQGFEYFWNKENSNDSTYAFNGLLTHMPQLDENYNRWERYFFDDYDVGHHRDKLWNYAVYTNRLIIDTPGINNRITALDLYRKGASGWLVWETFWWDHGRLDSDNPWLDPRAGRLGNGAVAHFYPPRRDGPASEPDFRVVPSLRIESYREGAEDYDYAIILEQLMAQAQNNGLDVAQAQTVMNDIDRFFYSSVLWSQNDAWYLELRNRMATAIVDLKRKLN